MTDCARHHLITVTHDSGQALIPAVAEDGRLCVACRERIRWRLDELPGLLQTARGRLIPSSTPGGEHVSRSEEAPAPLSLTVLDDVDDAVSALGNWVTFWAVKLSVRPPDMLAVAAAQDRDVLSVRAGAAPDDVYKVAQRLCSWLADWLDRIVWLDGVAAFHDDVVDHASRLRGRYGSDERGIVRQRARVCPVCLARCVRVTWEGTLPVVRCEACRHRFEVDWALIREAVAGAGRVGRLGGGGTAGRGDDADDSPMAERGHDRAEG